MDPVTFTNEEANFVLNAIDQYVRQTGLQNAQMGLTTAGKLSQAANGQEDSDEG